MSMVWTADPHVYGPGKSHFVDEENTQKTMCGKFINTIPGKWNETIATCRSCLNAGPAREEKKKKEEEWKIAREERRQQWEENRENRKHQYEEYLNSENWRTKRTAVLKRANGICEACLNARATEVHHLTYKHVFNEPLFDLVAICRTCHDSITEMDKIGGGR